MEKKEPSNQTNSLIKMLDICKTAISPGKTVHDSLISRIYHARGYTGKAIVGYHFEFTQVQSEW